MDGRAKTIEPLVWVEEYTSFGLNQQQQYKHQQPSPSTRKRKKTEFAGWGSRALIAFLESIGRDTSHPISQFDVTAIVNEYVERNLLQLTISNKKLDNQNTNKNKKKKTKRILCDERLRSLFGKKSISRIMIYKLLEPHLAAANQQIDSDDSLDFFSWGNEDDEGEGGEAKEKHEKSYRPKRLTVEMSTHTPRSCFAAVIPENIKLVYLKRSLIVKILKEGDTSTFETKIVGSFVRTKSDPNDYLQKHSHCLLQVTGLRVSGTDDKNTETLLQVSGFIKDIPISVLSDEDISKEECEDLHRRIKDGMLKRPTVVELQQKAHILHEDMTKHWLARELALLKNLIDRANEKGWRREYPFIISTDHILSFCAYLIVERSFYRLLTLFEYLERRELLQTPDEQSRLLHELPEVIAEEIEPETAPLYCPDEVKQRNNSSPGSILAGPREASTSDTREAETEDEREDEFELTWAVDDIISEESRRDNSMQVSQKEVQELRREPTKSNVQDSPKEVQELQKEPTKSIKVQELQKEVRELQEEVRDLQKEPTKYMNVLESQKEVQELRKESTESINVQELQKEVRESRMEPTKSMNDSHGGSEAQVVIAESKSSHRAMEPEVIELSDDDEDEEPARKEQTFDGSLGSSMWHYLDPQGDIQGPFAIISLKQWSDAEYFPPDFKIWKTGQSPTQAVHLKDILKLAFPK
ncbi:SWIB/MDM2 domain containing protein [Trema orientale]|uniref:SWIB/MDM2 domain containing protein n=1 Tax=Trema orientale TaxID=63057 RepID=A0A2P5DQ76_TREOI|nr:SWIB/MDM2 domain containing protein [Trema orientale]